MKKLLLNLKVFIVGAFLDHTQDLQDADDEIDFDIIDMLFWVWFPFVLFFYYILKAVYDLFKGEKK